jgi:hypothetical protein
MVFRCAALCAAIADSVPLKQPWWSLHVAAAAIAGFSASPRSLECGCLRPLYLFPSGSPISGRIKFETDLMQWAILECGGCLPKILDDNRT